MVIPMMNGCSNCLKIGGASFLVLGVIFLLRDFNIWDFWGIQWWTAAFVVIGIGTLGSAHCPNCQAVRGEKKK